MANEPQLDYEKEANEDSASNEYLKIGVGIHKITFLSELSPLVEKEIKGDKVQQTEALVEYDKMRKKWNLNKAKTLKSLYRQVLLYAKHHKSLVGKTIQVLVKESTDKNGDTKKEYSVIEVAELLQQQAKLTTPQ